MNKVLMIKVIDKETNVVVYKEDYKVSDPSSLAIHMLELTSDYSVDYYTYKVS